MFQMFAEMTHQFINPETMEAESTKKIKTVLNFPDLLRVKVFYADPEEPFTHTFFIIDEMEMIIKMPIHTFSSYIQNALNSDLFSKVSLN